MSDIASVSASSFYDRRESISVEADDRQQQAIASVLASGFTFDWSAIIGDAVADDPLPEMQAAVDAALQSEQFVQTVEALRVNGRLIAALAQQKHERLAGARAAAKERAIGGQSAASFAEPALFKPDGAISWWRRLLGLTDDTVEAMLQGARAFQPDEPFLLAGRIAKEVNSQLAALHEKSISEGLTLPEFRKQASEIMPDLARHVLDTEYRTRITQAYAGARHEQVVNRAAAFPFMQYLIIKDGRTTWWICLPMGTAGPGGRGYIAATDDAIWFIWRPPNHWQCRSDLSPISYLEAQRLGILAKDGKTKIAIVGGNPMRPFGEPPTFATGPGGRLRKVEPQDGFGGSGGSGSSAAAPPVAPVAPPAKPAPAPSPPPTPPATTSAPPKAADVAPKADAKVPPSETWARAKELGLEPTPPPAVTSATIIRDGIIRLLNGADIGGLVDIADLRAACASSLPGESFDRTLLGLWWNGNVQLQSNPTPSTLSAAQRALYVKHPRAEVQAVADAYFTAAGWIGAVI